jgi:hypothetical protein
MAAYAALPFRVENMRGIFPRPGDGSQPATSNQQPATSNQQPATGTPSAPQG